MNFRNINSSDEHSFPTHRSLHASGNAEHLKGAEGETFSFQLLKCEDVLLPVVIYDSKLNICEFWTVGQKQANSICNLGVWEMKTRAFIAIFRTNSAPKIFLMTYHFKVLSNKAVQVLLVPYIQLETENSGCVHIMRHAF